MKRGFLIGLPVVVVTLVGIALVAPGFVDWSQYKTQIQDQIKNATGHTALIGGDLSLAILPSPRVHIGDVQVAAPEGSAQPYLIKLGRLDVNLALLPLLSGKIDFDTISLVNPDIALEVQKDGKKNWMTPALEAMMKGSTTESGSAPISAPAISLRNVRIENGRFSYSDETGKAAPVKIENINVMASADSLRGPFQMNGSIGYGDREIEIKASTPVLEAGSTSVSLTLDATVKPENIGLRFAGAVDTAAPFGAQGETKLSIPSLKDLAGPGFGNEPVTLAGLLTATPDKIDLKDATLALGGSQFTGNLGAVMSPLKINADLTSGDTINLDKLIQLGGAPAKKTGGKGDFAVLPETLSFPVAFDAGVRLKAPSVIYSNQVFNGVTVMMSKQGAIFAAEIAASGVPGKASLEATLAAKYASQSSSQKDGSVLYADPALIISTQGKTQNIAQTVAALSGMEEMVALQAFRTADFDAKLDVKSDRITLQQTSLTLDGNPMALSGSYVPGSRPKMVVDLSADTLDVDALQKKMGMASDKKVPLQEGLRGLALPFDLDMDVGIQSARLQGYDIKGLRATGTFRENAVTFSNLSAQDFAGGAFKVTGGVGDIKNLSAIDVTLSAQAGDAKKIAKMAGYDIAALPAALQKATVALKATGTSDKLAVNADIAALNGNLLARGDVSNPLAKMTLSNLAIEVKHRNLAEAIQAFSPQSPRYVSLEKPFILKADVNQSGSVYSLGNLQANMAGSPVTGAVSFDTGASKPTLKADLTFDNLKIQSAGGGSKAVQSGSRGSKWSSEPIDSAWMNAMNADIKINANSIVYEGWDLQKPIIDLALNDGTLSIRQFESALFGGRMAMDGSVTAGAGNIGFSSVKANTKFNNVSFADLTSAMTGGTDLLRGEGDINMNAAIATAGNSQAALVGALSGDGTMNGKNIVLDGFDLTRFAEALSDENKPADTLQGLWKGVNTGGSTRFDAMDGAFSISRGIVTINKLNLTGQQANLATTGTVNLPTWMLDSAHTITLVQKPDVPPFTMKIAGPLDNPAQTFGQGAINDYFNRKLNRKLQNIISDKVGGDAGNILGTFLGVPPKAPKVAPAKVAPAVAPAATPEVVPDAAPAIAPVVDPSIAPAAIDTPAPEPVPDAAPVEAAPVEEAPASLEDQLKQKAIDGVLQGILGQ